MALYRKKPVVIEAIRWGGDNLKEVINFTGLHPSADKWTWGEYEKVVMDEGLKIFTLEGSHMATVGDMIIKGVRGEFYPCKPDIFEATYSEGRAMLNDLLDSGRVGVAAENANMYGCLPCPKCKSEYRWPTQKIHKTKPSMIICDDCGFDELISNVESNAKLSGPQ